MRCIAALSVVFIAAGLLGCNKVTYDEALPVTEIVSIRTVGYSTVEIKGKIKRAGGSRITQAGFCYNEDPNVDFGIHQVILQATDDSFSAIIRYLSQERTYYFKSFAVNDQGYGMSDVQKYTVLRVSAPVPPCNLPPNTIKVNGKGSPLSSHMYYSSYSEIGLSYGASQSYISLRFKGKLLPGKYKLTNDEALYNYSQGDLACIRAPYGAIHDGDIYVAENADHSFTIAFCDLDFEKALVSGKATVKM